MDLQGIGAIAAVPTTIVVGFLAWWGAARQAKAAAEAGREQARSAIVAAQRQAHSAYAAALDAVHEQAKRNHRQWRSNSRREAWATFLLAVSRFESAAVDIYELYDDGMISAAERNLEQANSALVEAFTIVDLEGPQEVADLARSLVGEVVSRAEYLKDMAPMHRASHALEVLLDREQTMVPTLDGSRCQHPAHDANDALQSLSRLWGSLSVSERSGALGESQWESIENARRQAQDALNACSGISAEHARALIYIFDRSREDWRSEQAHMEATEGRVEDARKHFLDAARAVLADV